MSDQDAQEAKARARTAGTQAKHAAKNTGRAAVHAVKAGADEAEEFYDAAKDKAPEVIAEAKDVAADAAQAVEQKASRFDTRALAAITGDMGQGFIALSVAIWAGTISFNKFATAFNKRNTVVR